VYDAASIMENYSPQPDVTVNHKVSVIDTNELEQAFRELHTLLKLNKISAGQKFSQMKQFLPDMDECKALENQISSFDFKGAQISLAKLADSMEITIGGAV
jgi:hypothetical protein